MVHYLADLLNFHARIYNMALSTNQTGFLGRQRWLVWAAGIAVAVILLASFMSRGEVVPVRVATVERSTIRSLVSTNGKG